MLPLTICLFPKSNCVGRWDRSRVPSVGSLPIVPCSGGGGWHRQVLHCARAVLFLGSPSPATVMALADIVGPVSAEAAYSFDRCGTWWAAEPCMRCTSGVDFGGVSGKSRGWEPHPHPLH